MGVKAVKQVPELELLAALQAARGAANALIQTEKGTVERNGKTEEFDTVPFHEVQAEERRLTAAHGLLLWTDNVSTVRVNDYSFELHARFTLVHLATGASKAFEFVGPCFPLSDHSNNGAWASEATKKYAWRCAVLQIFDIPVVKRSVGAGAAVGTQPRESKALTALVTSSGACLPYSGERLIDQLRIWSHYQQTMEIASVGKSGFPDLAMAEAWAACRKCAQRAGMAIRPLMPGDKPGNETENIELYHFLYAENLRDGQVSA